MMLPSRPNIILTITIINSVADCLRISPGWRNDSEAALFGYRLPHAVNRLFGHVLQTRRDPKAVINADLSVRHGL